MKYDLEVRVVGMEGDREVSRFQLHQEGMELSFLATMLSGFAESLVSWASKGAQAAQVYTGRRCRTCRMVGHNGQNCPNRKTGTEE
jgi:hypothetical protein